MTHDRESVGACVLCAAESLNEFEAYRGLPRVTSDARRWPVGGQLCICMSCGALQKPATARWREEIDRIYGTYQIYYQSAGAEQRVFDIATGDAQPRSSRLVRFLNEQLNLRSSGRLLDFGCGTGATLRAFSEVKPSWQLFGAELSDASASRLARIPGFVRLFVGDELGFEPVEFDLVTLVHSLEHVIDPVGVLRTLAQRLHAAAHLFIEVPDCEQNPYDLVIADHLMHFTPDTLRLTTHRAGYSEQCFTNALLPKELTWLGKPGEGAGVQATPTAAHARAAMQLRWLCAQIEDAKRIAAGAVRFGIFGTSISATWLDGALGGSASFFVDEDTDRIGREHLGRPILAPESVPADCDVFVPLIPRIAASVEQRVAHRSWRMHTPGAMELVNA